MTLKHTNPRPDRMARAPYNFVPLPEKIVPARDPLPGHNAYVPGTLTGWLECELETCSPTYVRGMLTAAQFAEQGEKKSDALTKEQKEARAPFFSTTDEEIEGRPCPTIPGSSLRGMIRALVEIAGYGRMRWVGKEPTFTFRAVAAMGDDPLRDRYKEALGHWDEKGRYHNDVRAGYLQQEGDEWFIVPAKVPASAHLPEKNPYLKIKEYQILKNNVIGYIPFDHKDYRPQWYEVSFDAEIREGEKGRYVAVTQIGKRDDSLTYQGVLVCSGNMKETQRESNKEEKKGNPKEVRRQTHALVLLPDKAAKRLKISAETVRDYLAGLSPFQKENLTAWNNEDGKSPKGCLQDGAPVFYVAEGDQVLAFGHSPNFRVPARLVGENRAATPFDFVPSAVRDDPRPDLADAIFGWVEEKEGGPKEQRAGRVSFGDAHYVGNKDGVWLKSTPLAPHTLSTPKPTTFQHYLVQNREAEHDPDDKKSLAHYGSSPSTTEIRGHKLYWHRGEKPDLEATEKERQHEDQLTRIIPLKPGVRFVFKIHFENLHPEELGALGWALTLPGETGKVYRHKLGMGKPLGMGAVALTPRRLVLTDRQARYARLFDGESFDLAATAADLRTYVNAFDAYVRERVAPDKSNLAQVERIQALLTMLEWREGTPAWLDRTRYMEIERGDDKVNEYKERPVLPEPATVVKVAPMFKPRGRPSPTGSAKSPAGKKPQKKKR